MLQAEYVYAAGQRVAVLKPSGSTKEVQYYFNDHLGSARALWSQTTNSAKWAADYYPYGEVEAQTGSEGESRFGFTGHETDFATDLVYAGARYYDAETGRWLQVDPLASSFPGHSPYNYAMNNPLLLIDPTGMSAEEAGGGPCDPPRDCNAVSRSMQQAEQMWNQAASTVSGAVQTVQETAANITETVVKDGPEVLDGFTYALSGTSIAATTVAIATAGPTTPDDVISLSVAGLAGMGATVTNGVAAFLSQADALHYGGGQSEADKRIFSLGVGLAVGKLAGGVLSAQLNRTLLGTGERAALRGAAETSASSAAESAAIEAAKRR